MVSFNKVSHKLALQNGKIKKNVGLPSPQLNLVKSGHTFVFLCLISGNFLLILDLKVIQSIQMLLSAGEGGFEKRPQYAQRNPVPQGPQVG